MVVALAAAAALALAVLPPGSGGAGAQATTTTTTAPIPPPAAYVVVDAATGAVLLAQNADVRRPPASTSKLITALVARSRLKESALVTVSPAAAAMPARKLNLQPGQRWKEGDLLQAMLLCSCNDIARALAEAAGGSVGGFGTLARRELARLGARDAPVVQDPAGLDDEFSVGGGNRISARDLAIVARAFLADPILAAMVRTPTFRWLGPDLQVHSVHSENRLFGTYEGAIGIKTGYTKRAGATFVAAATRGGRTIIAVILGSQSIWYHAPQLLDYGFRAAVTPAMERLPAVPAAPGSTVPTGPPTTGSQGSVAPVTPPTTVDAQAPVAPQTSPRHGRGTGALLLALGAVLVLLGVAVAARRRQVLRRRARRRAARRDEALAALVGDPTP